MFRKNNDQMFRKAQMKLFTMIVSILLAVFIALISSINVITKAVMRGQSKEVLMQIAAGTEYNDKELKFMFTPPDNGEPKNGKPSEPAKKPSEAPVTTAQVTTAVITTETSATTTKATETTTSAVTSEEETTDTENYEENEYEQQEQPEAQPSPNDDQGNQNEVTFKQPETQPRQPETQPRRSESQESQQEWTAPTLPNNDNNNNNGGQGSWGDWGSWGSGDGQNGGWGGDGSQNGWGNGQYDPNWNPYDPWNPWNPWNPWSPWNPWNQQQWGQAPKAYSNENDDFDYESYHREHGGEAERYDDSEPRLMQTVYSGEDVLDGFTVLANRDGGDEVTYADKNDKSRKAAPNPETNPMGASKVEPIPKSLGSIDFFVLMSDKDGHYLAKLYNEDLKADDAQECITDILDKDADTGMYHSYQYYQADKSNGNLIVLTDKSYEMDMLRQLKRTTIIIGSIALIILSILAYFLSKKSIQPIKIAFNKQKQFVSDASHELKTPLTVISANTDVLQGEIGENKWLNYIKSQTDRMNVLVNDLLNLTRLENNTVELEYKYFNMSKAIVNTALPFECQAFESNKQFEVDVDDNIMLCGSEKHVKQMAAIFIDNALKYSNDGGTVRVSLKKVGGRKVLSVFNTGEGIKVEDQDKIFERFFRSDESRNRATGGYGLGLAIAKSIIDKHKFKLNIINQPGESVCFAVTMD